MARKESKTPIAATSLKYRPRDYFGRYDLQTELLTHVKGRARRNMIRQALEEGKITDVPSYLKDAELDDVDRQMIGRIHPMYMGGEYLPRLKHEEVEVARISIKSTTYDVTVLYARVVGHRIHYRVADEYGGDTLAEQSKRTSLRPLTMGKMIEFFLGAWDLMACLEGNFDDDLEGMLDFFRGESEFYPYFDATLREMVKARFRDNPDPVDTSETKGDTQVSVGSIEGRLSGRLLAALAGSDSDVAMQKTREEILSRSELWHLATSILYLDDFPDELKPGLEEFVKSIPPATGYASGMARMMTLAKLRGLAVLFWKLTGFKPRNIDFDRLYRSI